MKNKSEIMEAERIKLGQLSNKATGAVRHDSTFVNFMKTILIFTMSLEKEGSKKPVVNHILGILRDMWGSEFLTGMGAQSFYRYIRIAKMMLMDENVLALVKILNAEDAGPRTLRTCHSDDIGLYTATTEELTNMITLIRNFAKDQNEPAPVHVPTFYNSTKMFLGRLSVGFVDHRTASASDVAELLNVPMFQTRTTSIPLLHFSAACMCTAMIQVSGKELGRLYLKVVSRQCRIIP